VAFVYEARTTAEVAIVRVRVKSRPDGHEIQIDSEEGWESGRMALADGLEVKLPLRRAGENRFRAIVFDPSGRPVPSASAELTIVRIHASARSIPATRNLAVMIRESDAAEHNELEIFLVKGAELPKSGMKPVRAARSLKSDEEGYIDIQLFQQDCSDVPDPGLGLFIGASRIHGSDLPEGVKIAKGDQINNHWHVDEGGLLTASVELPGVGLRYEEKRFYCPEIGHRPFEGEGGRRLAESALEEVENDLEQASQVVANGADSELEDVRRRLARQRDQLEQALDADDRRSATEEARRLRHEIARMLHRPEHRGAVLSRPLAELKGAFNYRAREIADADAARRFDELASKAVLELARGRAGFATAEQQL
jgi:molecular chaperone DnaK